MLRGVPLILLVAAASLFVGCETPAHHKSGMKAEAPAVPFLVRTNYRGWTDAIILNNGRVEAIIVPEIGRVMQFRFIGDPEGPFWDNRDLYGKMPDPNSKEWMNFGGDKAWPSPQSEWDRKTPRAWPPPAGFDAMRNQARIDDRVVTLVSPVDPNYGIRVLRRIELDLDRPVMKITTTFERISGQPMEVGVWVISQLKSPVAVYVPVPQFTRYREGYNLQSQQLPPDFRREGDWIVVKRDPKASHKFGTDANRLIWMDRHQVLVIDSPRVLVDSKYPDQESSAEVYTNQDPLAYVELEMLGPLRKTIVGDKISRTSTYTLLPRREADPDLEAARLMAR
jgi:hypothetical protein